MLSEDEKQAIIERVSKKAGDYEEAFISCAQGTLLALQEEFHLGGGTDIIRAASFMPGVASRKETCGAFLGALMALGLLFGRANPLDTAYSGLESRGEFAERKKRTAWRFCEELKNELGSTQCSHVHAKLMGKEYDFMDSESFGEFLKDGGAQLCRIPPEKAARIAARIILEEYDRQETASVASGM
ncbi:MAG: C-GCAxxG-C-C family protein [Dehalococcoidia bacterium]|nr:C-GCAxxG-C-C family protein [Dehalococcoidia bacterium]